MYKVSQLPKDKRCTVLRSSLGMKKGAICFAMTTTYACAHTSSGIQVDTHYVNNEVEEEVVHDVNPKIMVVDDSLFMRMLLKNVIRELGYEVTMEASNGVEALSLYSDERPDLVTLDITMPEMDGLTALEKIKDLNPNAKVIMVSAMGQQALLIRAVSMGASDFIVKPFSKDRVKEALKRAFAG